MPTLGTGVFVYRRRSVSPADAVELTRSQLNDPRAQKLCNILFRCGPDHEDFQQRYGPKTVDTITDDVAAFLHLSTRAVRATSQLILEMHKKATHGPLEFLVQKRGPNCSRAPGVWALPGGMDEETDTLSGGAKREVFEESGLEIALEVDNEFQVNILGVSDHRPRENHVTAWVAAKYLGGHPVIKEPGKCVEWRWVTIEEFSALALQVGEQVYWSPLSVWRRILAKLEAESCLS